MFLFCLAGWDAIWSIASLEGAWGQRVRVVWLWAPKAWSRLKTGLHYSYVGYGTYVRVLYTGLTDRDRLISTVCNRVSLIGYTMQLYWHQRWAVLRQLVWNSRRVLQQWQPSAVNEFRESLLSVMPTYSVCCSVRQQRNVMQSWW